MNDTLGFRSGLSTPALVSIRKLGNFTFLHSKPCGIECKKVVSYCSDRFLEFCDKDGRAKKKKPDFEEEIRFCEGAEDFELFELSFIHPA
jgi:hypothetical protein